MRKTEGRTIGLYFKVSPEEMALIEKKMEQAGTGNKRAYLRKMAVDGYIVHLEGAYKTAPLPGGKHKPDCPPL